MKSDKPYKDLIPLSPQRGVSRITTSKYLKELEEIGILKSRRVWKYIIYINTNLFAQLKS